MSDEPQSSGLYPLYTVHNDSWRVPLKVNDGWYKLWVDRNYARVYSARTLPDLVKQKLAMINAKSDQVTTMYEEYGYEDDRRLNIMALLHPTNISNAMEDVGWRYNDFYYCLVVSDLEMDSLRSESLINRETERDA